MITLLVRAVIKMKQFMFLKANILMLIISVFLSVVSFEVNALSIKDSALSGDQFIKLIELIVIAIISSALIISALVLFLGKWAGQREQKAIKIIRQNAEIDKNEIASAISTIRGHEKETTELVGDINDLAKKFSQKRKEVEIQARSIFETSKKIQMQEQALIQTTNTISLRMNKIQSYWDSQLNSTISTIQEVQANLDKSLNQVDEDLGTMQHQKKLSQELLQDFLGKHKEQSELINNNFDISEKVGLTLEETLQESTLLVSLLKQHQNNAERSLSKFTEDLTGLEEQAYEQFDSSFQVADLARQELTANIDESRTHIKSMRRHEEQSQQLNRQTQKNLEVLDYSKIMKISKTLDSTQDMFTDIHRRVEDTKKLLDELKDIETDVKEATKDREENHTIDYAEESLPEELNEDDLNINANVYKMASGDNTPLSFFTNIKKKDQGK